MNAILLSIILIPIVEIYLFIEIGGKIGAFNTIMATLLTAGIGLYFVRQQGLATVYSALNSIERNNSPIFEVLGAFCLVIAAICLIIPGFITDILGALLLIPITRKIFLRFFVKKNSNNQKDNSKIIDINPEDIDERK